MIATYQLKFGRQGMMTMHESEPMGLPPGKLEYKAATPFFFHQLEGLGWQ